MFWRDFITIPAVSGLATFLLIGGTVLAAITFSDNFENGIGSQWGREGYETYSTVSGIGGNSSRAVKFDWPRGSIERTELRARRYPMGSDRWYGVRVFIPESTSAGSLGTIIHQIHGGREAWNEGYVDQPPVFYSLYTINGQTHFTVSTRHTADGNYTRDRDDLIRNGRDFGVAPKNRWIQIVTHVRWRADSGGLVESFIDGAIAPSFSKQGIIGWRGDDRGPFAKIGIYNSDSSRLPERYPSRQILYFDDYREGSTRAEVESGSTSPTPSPSPTPPTNTTFINEGFSQASDINNINVIGGGLWQVQNGKLRLSNPASGTGNANLVVHDTSVPNGNFTLTAEGSVIDTSSEWNDFSVVFGFEDVNNYYYASFNESNDAATSGIFRVSNATTTQLSDISQPIAANTPYNVRVERRGAQIRVFLNDAQAATATDSTFAGGGRVGFGTRNDSAAFDNLRVTR